MRTVDVAQISDAVAALCVDTNTCIGEDHLQALRRAHDDEESELGREVLAQLLENAEVACRDRVPFCADTGYAVVFADVGQDVHLAGGTLRAAIDAGVHRGYTDGYLRASMVVGPLERTNTGDNTPAVVYTELVEGDAIDLTLLVKGAGCDNVSDIRMLTPADGRAGIVDMVVDTIARAGPSASPPVTVGVGVGGPFERAALLAKRALTRASGTPNRDPHLAALEQEILDRINATGIGPAGYGGRVTALAVHVEAGATHIAQLPVAVNVDCHSHRVGSVTL